MQTNNLSSENAFLAGEYVKERGYWLEKLSGDIERSEFPYDFKRETQPGEPGTGKVKANFSPELVAKITRAMNGSDTRLQMILTAGLMQLIYKYTGKEDIIIGTPIEKQEADGEYVNTALVLRQSIDHEKNLRQILPQTRTTLVEAFENHNYPIETLIYDLNIPTSDKQEFPLFSIAILLENLQEINYLKAFNADVIFAVLRTVEGIELTVHYKTACYAKQTIERISSHYTRLLTATLAAPDMELGAIQLLTESEMQELVHQFNKTGAQYPHHLTIHEKIRQQAEKTPTATAIQEAATQRTVTYKELDSNGDRLAAELRKKGVKTGTIVPIMGQRKIEIITGLIAVLKAGGAYLPIDAKNPAQRIAFILADSGAEIILTQRHLIQENQALFTNLKPGQ
ncbi:MAG: AMP-binding protein, partial [bacterium]|nr:AMP-binding protein [bacterium]